MRKHGRGPKDVFVRKYPRWVKGRRRRVASHKRGADPILSLKRSERQMTFGFDPPGATR